MAKTSKEAKALKNFKELIATYPASEIDTLLKALRSCSSDDLSKALVREYESQMPDQETY